MVGSLIAGVGFGVAPERFILCSALTTFDAAS
jgi:hypothetical protein